MWHQILDWCSLMQSELPDISNCKLALRKSRPVSGSQFGSLLVQSGALPCLKSMLKECHHSVDTLPDSHQQLNSSICAVTEGSVKLSKTQGGCSALGGAAIPLSKRKNYSSSWHVGKMQFPHLPYEVR